MGRRTYAGAASATTLASGITGLSTSIAVVDATGWPSPSGGTVSVAVINRGGASEEKITFSGRTGNTLTGCVRGFDSTAAASHLIGEAIEHSLSATDIDEVNDHVFDTTNDDHTQYFNAARHAATPHTTAMIEDLAIGTADIADGAVTLAKLAAALLPLFVPTGGTIAYTGTAAPTGFLLCDGSLVSTTTYAALFAVTGHSYNGGADPGGGNFKLPDLRFKVPLGKAAAGTGSTLGGTGGSANAVAVSHGHANTLGVSVGNENAHTHTTGDGGALVHSLNGVNANDMAVRLGGSVESLEFTSPSGTRTTFTNINDHAAHNHGGTGVGSSHGHTGSITGAVTDAGSSGTDANLQPYQVFNYIVKT